MLTLMLPVHMRRKYYGDKRNMYKKKNKKKKIKNIYFKTQVKILFIFFVILDVIFFFYRPSLSLF